MPATIADYAWWQSFRPEWADAYCVTLVGDATPDQVIDGLGARTVGRASGIDALLARTVEHWGPDHNPDGALIAAADVGHGWTLIAEVNGYLGVTAELIEPVSAGRTIVSHFRNINAVYQFTWWQDGQVRADLDLLFPAERAGTDPVAAAGHLRDLGVPLGADDDVSALDLSAIGFALTERITGVACTLELFERADFTVAVVPMPGG